MPPIRKAANILAALWIASYFLILAGEGVFAYFTHDDLMNLYKCWLVPMGDVIKANFFFFSGFYRPMGALFYRTVYAVAGFDPLPFRIACYLLMLVNLYIGYCLARRLSGSREIA